MAFVDQPGADGGTGIVAAAGDDGDAGGQAGQGGGGSRDLAGDLGALEHLGQQVGRHVEGGQHLLAVGTPAQIQKQRARSVGGVGGMHAGQPEADEVLWQHELRESCRGGRLVPAQPQQLRRLEARAGAVAGDRDHPLAADPRVDLIAFGVRARIVPEQGRADRVAVAVEEHRAVHLARQPTAAMAWPCACGA